MSKTDPHVEGYAGRIAEGLRYNHYPSRLTGLDAQFAASVYRVEVPREPTTIRELALAIADVVMERSKG